jgi:hypothetical protein
MSALLAREKPGPLVSAGDELAARAELRRQIGRLELELGRLAAEAFPRLRLNTAVGPAAAMPRALDLGELERVRNELATRVSEARGDLDRKGELETRNRELLDDMLARPEDHKWLRISRDSLGEPGCGHWHSRPRFGLLGMLMGWWRVKISSGCPL